MRLRKWRHPETFDLRIYVSADEFPGRVWLENSNGSICIRAPEVQDPGPLEDWIDGALTEHHGIDLTTPFHQLAKLATW